MKIRQTRIFTPWKGWPYATNVWAETAFGRIIKPVLQSRVSPWGLFPIKTTTLSRLKWFWFSRYECPQRGPGGDSGDCDITKVPLEKYMNPETGRLRSIRFRYCVSGWLWKMFEKVLAVMVEREGCFITDFRDYDVVGDLGSDRHTEKPMTPKSRRARASLVLINYCSVSSLVIDALKGPDKDGLFCLPHHLPPDPDCKESIFGVTDHIHYNITGYMLAKVLPSFCPLPQCEKVVREDWTPDSKDLIVVRTDQPYMIRLIGERKKRRSRNNGYPGDDAQVRARDRQDGGGGAR